MKKIYLLLFAPFILLFFACATGDESTSVPSDTLATVVERGILHCGIKDSQPGFGYLQPDGTYAGQDVEYCKAVAAAVLGDANKVKYVPATAKARFEMLKAGEIDVLIRTTTWTASRDASLKSSFAVTTFYDGQGMMVKSDSGITSMKDLTGATICVTTGTTTEQNLDDWFTERNLDYQQLAVENDAGSQAAFIAGRCDGWTGDKSNLAGQRSKYPSDAGGSDALTILPITLSKEPLGPVTRDNDSKWFDVVNWVVIGTIAAEEMGISSQNLQAHIANPKNKNQARLLGVGWDGGEVTDLGLGISADFMQKVLYQVGNYGEIYARTIEPIGIPRSGSLNALWTQGGIIYAPPMR